MTPSERVDALLKKYRLSVNTYSAPMLRAELIEMLQQAKHDGLYGTPEEQAAMDRGFRRGIAKALSDAAEGRGAIVGPLHRPALDPPAGSFNESGEIRDF